MPPSALPCSTCGLPVTEGALFCTACGARTTVSPLAAPVLDSARCAIHPEAPAAQPCPRCGTFACDACLRQEPDGTVRCGRCHVREGGEPLPWDQRAELGTLRAYWRTSVLLMNTPGVLATATPYGSVGSSLLYLILATLFGFSATLLFYGAVIFAALAGVFSSLETPAAWAVLLAVPSLFGVVIFANAVMFFLLSGIEHLTLRMVGAKPRGFEVTLRAHALSMAPCLVGLVPFCGNYVWGVWSVVLRVLTLRDLHRTTTGRALTAALMPVILAFVLGVAVVAASVAIGSSLTQGAS